MCYGKGRRRRNPGLKTILMIAAGVAIIWFVNKTSPLSQMTTTAVKAP